MNTIATVNAGIYCRLSVDDQTSGESESIQTQKALLADYCKQHGFRIVDYFIDDGVSGTSFERPEFGRMLAAIEAGQINTVICKDLSHFGRNYYEAGMYLDRYFVQNDIRFIAPGDNVDTIRGKSDLNVAIINMMNDFYARGISEKTKAAKQIRAKQGLFVGSKPPYGYARYSSDNQREESIERQLRECKEFAERQGITILTTYIDRALSAKTDNRPEFQRMIKDSAKGLFDVVIVWKLDRFARNRYDSAHFWLHRFRKTDSSDPEQRQRLIDIFVNSAFVFDDRIIFTFNYKDGTKTISLDDVKSLDMVGGSPPNYRKLLSLAVTFFAFLSTS